MKARDWRAFLEAQRAGHRKALFTVTELANAAGVGRNALNVELSRLLRQGIVLRYAHGLYGLPGAVTVDDLLPAIDAHAYMTGLHALHRHHLVAQIPTAITCFTDRRSPRARVRPTPVGRLVFVCVRSRVYHPPAGGPMAGPEQALCDFLYLCRRDGIAPSSQVTFLDLGRLQKGLLLEFAERYPSTVIGELRDLTGGPGPR